MSAPDKVRLRTPSHPSQCNNIIIRLRRPVEEFIRTLQTLSPTLIYLAVFCIAFVENIFPPSPSDIVIVFAGSLVGIEKVGYIEVLLASTAGSTLGFVAMYKIGEWFGDKILEQGKIKFIPVESVRKVEAWFQRYGYWIIVVNRFLAGTRAVVSFFAGMSELRFVRTTILCALSALAWNAILVASGYYLGSNWERLGSYMSTYSEIMTGLLILAALVFLTIYFSRKKKGKTSP